jgi:hypothetical protein
MTDCPFCQHLASDDVAESNAHAVVFADACPGAAVRARLAPRRRSCQDQPAPSLAAR